MNQMKNLLFVPLTKVDLVKREVWGVGAQEVADKSGEIMDYATSKPLFESWSGTAEKMSGGLSLGNVREMHGKSAAGKLTSFTANDAEKRFEVCAKVVDDKAWEKVVQGVYTGFSIGGSYAKRWSDGDLTRYTASPSEISLVDSPCIPTATFTMVKADGVQEQVAFKKPSSGAKLKKGMYGVSTLASLLSSLQYCAEDSKMEAMYEGDASEVPAKLKEAVKTLGEILVQMVQEETAELTPEDDDMSAASEKMMKVLEAMEARLVKMEAEKPAEQTEKAKVEQATDAETGTVVKEVPGKPTAEDEGAEKMLKLLEVIEGRLAKVEAQPAAPSGAKPVVVALDKAADGKVIEKAVDTNDPLALVKMAHAKPKFLAKSDLGDYMGVSGVRV